MFGCVFHNIIMRTILPWLYMMYVMWCIVLGKMDIIAICILLLPFLQTIIEAYSAIAANKKIKNVLEL